MRPDEITEKVKIPEGVTVTCQDYELKAKGPKGELTRKITTHKVDIKIENNKAVFTSKKPTKREKTMIYTYAAHLKNMFKGVTEGHTYRLKICSGHFPMTVSYKNSQVEIKNFLGEKVPRTVRIKEGVDLKVEGDRIIITSTDKELAGQTASAIEQITRRKGFDKRIFQDGIYLTEKDGKAI